MDILREDEQIPDNYPEPPANLTAAALAIEPMVVWERLEHWIVYRWGVRTVEWITEGGGWFVPRLKPAELDTVQRWTGTHWEGVEPVPAPMGVWLDEGTHKLTYTVGTADTPPDTVLVAYTRLAEFWAEETAEAGATSITDGDYSVTRSANTFARGLYYSGAADLLRRYRQ